MIVSKQALMLLKCVIKRDDGGHFRLLQSIDGGKQIFFNDIVFLSISNHDLQCLLNLYANSVFLKERR